MGDVQGRFAVVPWMVMERLDAQEMGLYCALAVHADKNGWCWPSQHTLAKIVGKSQPWVNSRLKALEQRMVIERSVTPTGTKYRLPISCSLYPEEVIKVSDNSYQPADPSYQSFDINNTKNNITPLVISKDMTVSPSKLADGWADFKTDFERMWEMYPRKVGKGAARKAFAKVVRTVTASEFVNAYFRALERWERDKTEVQFIPHLATWLNQERWSDG